MNDYQTLRALCIAVEHDLLLVTTKNQKSSATRARASLLSMDKLCSSLRKQIMDHIKSVPPKAKKAVTPEVVEDPPTTVIEEPPTTVIEEPVAVVPRPAKVKRTPK